MYDYFKQEIVVPEVPEETTKPVEEPKESAYPWRKTNNVVEVYISIASVYFDRNIDSFYNNIVLQNILISKQDKKEVKEQEKPKDNLLTDKPKESEYPWRRPSKTEV